MAILGTLAGGDAGGAAAAGGFEAGTKIVFQQTAAPTGWTKDTTHNDKALRVVSGAASNGGVDSFSTTFGSGKTTASHTLSTPQIPAHGHAVITGPGGATNLQRMGAPVAYGPGATVSGYVTPTGGGGSHSHNLPLDIAYVDTIIATKD